MTRSESEDLAAPESWETADLDAAVSRLVLSSSKKEHEQQEEQPEPQPSAETPASASSSTDKLRDDAINQVDQFLREAIQNPRERLSVLRMEQDVEKFIRDPSEQQMEFQHLPTSYLRLAAHRVAQHYSLQSMVLLDNSLPDGSGSRIIVQKTSECRFPAIRLADIPVSLPSENSGPIKVAIKQRPQNISSAADSSSSNSGKKSSSKSVDERKEEYNRARARIFSSNSSSGGHSGRPETEHRLQDSSRLGSSRTSRMEEKSSSGASDVPSARGLIGSSTSNDRTSRSRTEESVRYKPNSRVAIFRDRDIDRTDPDYDRSYERYAQRFDPGFGFNGQPYTIQPMFTPALNYNTEFPQLGPTHRPQISVEHHPRLLPQHLPGPWVSASSPAAMAYGYPETMVTTFSPSHVGSLSAPAMYLHSSQIPGQQRGIPYIRPHEQSHQPFAQFHQPQTDATYGLARPRRAGTKEPGWTREWIYMNNYLEPYD